MLPVKLLDAVTATGLSPAKDTEGSSISGGVLYLVTGSPASFRLDLEGSMDGVTWVEAVSTTNPNTYRLAISPSQGAIYNIRYRYYRLNLRTLTGGTSPTVTAWLTQAA